jgi:hypothetical protein
MTKAIFAGVALTAAAMLAAAAPQPSTQVGESRNAARSVRFTKKHLFVGPHENATVGDLNLDGHLDIVSGAYWFAGPDFVPRTYRPNHLAKEYHRGNSDHVVDVDKDGWPDIVVGGWGQDGIIWYRNPGNGAVERGKPWEMHEPWPAQVLSRTRGTMEMFALHDYDGDGLPELHSANYRKNEPLEVWRFTTDADGSHAVKPFVLGAEGGGHGFAWGDGTATDARDVLTEIGLPRAGGRSLRRPVETSFLRQLPAPQLSVRREGRQQGRTARHRLRPRARHRPLLVGTAGAAVDATTTWKKHVIDESWSQAHALALADLDGDRDEELIAGKCIWAHEGGDPGAAEPPAIYYYRWERTKNAFSRHQIAAPGENIALGRQYASSI